ncbi:MAG TPA: sn-glycerol-3-phosphate ABC transporter ATP-binding protein UgpC [Nocardioides sp.]|nr:sn-glycerol-3-phosphate ABC transporter ATP-binding protein UgpC [Nocardioides sp.]
MATVTFKGAQRWYPGAAEPAVPGLDLEIRDGEFMVLVGPSGCGKSTTLRMLAGLEPVDEGGVFIDDRDVTGVPPKSRDIAMVFQNYALYPHMTVEENMGFALRMAKMKSSERRERVLSAAEMLGLTDYLGRRPRALSGGQRQRVAMGRAIVRNPAVFCMDEPLSNLDAKMRVQTRADIARLQAELGTTTVYVTHDQVEAMTMGHRVAVMHDGELQQVDAPLTLYDKPANLFVAGFIGSPRMNLLEATVVDGNAVVGDVRIPVPRAAVGETRGSVTIGVRPEAFRLVPADRGGLPMEVLLVEELGADSFVHGFADIDGERQLLIVRSEERGSVQKGDVVHALPDAARVHVFDPETGARL